MELVRRFVRELALRERVERALAAHGLRSDYDSGRLALLILALLIVGAVGSYLAAYPLVDRSGGLRRLPTARPVVNSLKQFTRRSLAALAALKPELALRGDRRRGLRLTIDVDGTVICTGAQVAWAFRGFNTSARTRATTRCSPTSRPGGSWPCATARATSTTAAAPGGPCASSSTISASASGGP